MRDCICHFIVTCHLRSTKVSRYNHTCKRGNIKRQTSSVMDDSSYSSTISLSARGCARHITAVLVRYHELRWQPLNSCMPCQDGGPHANTTHAAAGRLLHPTLPLGDLSMTVQERVRYNLAYYLVMWRANYSESV